MNMIAIHYGITHFHKWVREFNCENLTKLIDDVENGAELSPRNDNLYLRLVEIHNQSFPIKFNLPMWIKKPSQDYAKV